MAKGNIPEVKADVPLDEFVVNQPSDDEYGSKVYIKADDGLEYVKSEVKYHPIGKTVKAKNSAKFWEGTPQEFKDQFDAK